MRPSSRGGAGYGVQTGYGAAVPGVGARPGSSTRPGSSARVGSARIGTGRLGTGAAPVYTGVGLNTDVKIQDRPVTREGMVGHPSTGMGPGRQVEDASYYVGIVRKKNQELLNEINKMKTEIEQVHKDSNMYQHLERKYEALITEVRNLEGQLADYNLAMDKSRGATDPEEIQQYYMGLKAKNEAQAYEIDKIFLARQDRDKQTGRIEEQIMALRRQAEARLNALPEEQREEYRRLMGMNGQMADAISRKQEELEQVNQTIAGMEEQLRRDVHRDEYARLSKQLQRVSKERASLEEELRETQLDPATAREKLLAKARADNQRLVELTETLNRQQDEITRKKKAASDLAMDLEERKGESGDSHKYEVLYQRDEEMTTFINNFEETKAAQMNDQKKAQANIVALLEHISKNMERQHHLPTKAQVADMNADLTFKQRAAESAETTHARLVQELQKRRSELEKIDTLDSKISVELHSLNTKIKSMSDELVTLVDLDSLKTRFEQNKAQLVAAKQRYQHRRDMIRGQVTLLSSEYDRVKSMTSGHKLHDTFEKSEQKLRSYEQKIFTLREFISTKGKETEYEALAEECQTLTDDVNAQVIRAQAMMAPSLVQAAPY